MTYRGTVKNGAIVLDKPAELPDGLKVSIRPLKASRRPTGRKTGHTLYDTLKDFAGKAHLPPDAARNHDHYLYGCPKK